MINYTKKDINNTIKDIKNAILVNNFKDMEEYDNRYYQLYNIQLYQDNFIVLASDLEDAFYQLLKISGFINDYCIDYNDITEFQEDYIIYGYDDYKYYSDEYVLLDGVVLLHNGYIHIQELEVIK